MRNRRGCGKTLLWIGLMLLFSVMSAILFMKVDTDCGKLYSSYYNDVGEWKFCPHCGTTMEGSGE